MYVRISKYINSLDRISRYLVLETYWHKYITSYKGIHPRKFCYVQKKVLICNGNLQAIDFRDWKDIYEAKMTKRRRYSNLTCLRINALKVCIKKYQLNL
jgi:hypothetical protein